MSTMDASQSKTAISSDPRVVEVSRCALVVLSGGQRGLEHTVDADLFRVGKAPDNDLVLEDETVSRNHCEITRDAKGYLVRDLG